MGELSIPLCDIWPFSVAGGLVGNTERSKKHHQHSDDRAILGGGFKHFLFSSLPGDMI